MKKLVKFCEKFVFLFAFENGVIDPTVIFI